MAINAWSPLSREVPITTVSPRAIEKVLSMMLMLRAEGLAPLAPALTVPPAPRAPPWALLGTKVNTPAARHPVESLQLRDAFLRMPQV